MSDELYIHKGFMQALLKMQNESNAQRILEFSHFEGEYHVKVDPSIKAMALSHDYSKLLNEAYHGNTSNFYTKVAEGDEQAGTHIASAMGNIDGTADAGVGAGGAGGQQNPMSQLMGGMQQMGQAGAQQASQLAGQLPKALEGGPFKDLFKNAFQSIQKIVETATKAGGGHDHDDSGHDSDHETDAHHDKGSHDDKNHGKSDVIPGTNLPRDTTVTINDLGSHHLQVNPETGPTTASGPGGDANVLSPSAEPSAELPKPEPIDAATVASTDPADASGLGDAAGPAPEDAEKNLPDNPSTAEVNW